MVAPWRGIKADQGQRIFIFDCNIILTTEVNAWSQCSILLPHNEGPSTDRRGRGSSDARGQGLSDMPFHGSMFGFGEVIQPITREGHSREEVDGTVIRTVRGQ